MMSVKQILALILGMALMQSLGNATAFGRDPYTSRQARPYNGPYQGGAVGLFGHIKQLFRRLRG